MITFKKTIILFLLSINLLPCSSLLCLDPVKKVAASSKTLLDASKNGDLAMVKRLLSMANIAINSTNQNGVTPLMMATWNEFAEVTKELLACGANPQTGTASNKDFNFGKYLSNTNKKTTALMLAAAIGNLRITQLLLQAGAQVDAQDSDGQTALIYAILGDKNWPHSPLDAKRKAIIELLLNHNANPNLADNFGQDAIYYYSVVAGLVPTGGSVEYETDQKTLNNDPIYKRMNN